MSAWMGDHMRKFLLTTAAVLLASSVYAADAAKPILKAQPVAYPYDTSGFYFGVNSEAAVAQSNVSGTGGLFATSLVNGNLTAAGGAVGGTVGWIKGGATGIWWAVQGTLDYQNITASAPVTGANVNIVSRWSTTQVVKVGGLNLGTYLPALTGVNFPTFQLPLAPNGIALAATQKPYVMGGIAEQGISGNFGAVGGTSWNVAAVLGVGVLAPVVDSSGKPTGAALDLYSEVIFAGRGVTFNNVFGRGNVMLGAAANIGTTYKAGIGLYW